MSFELVGVRLVADNGDVYIADMRRAEGATADFGKTADKTFKQMPSLSDAVVGGLHRIGAAAVDAFMQAGQAAVGFVTDSIGVAGDFEQGMNKFAAVAGSSLDEAGLSLKDFRDQFIQIGKELPVSTSEVQQAATEMVKGGIDPATVAAGGLRQVIQFAAAADLSLADASTVAAKALGGWVDQAATAQEKADFLSHSTDLLSKAANASTVDVSDLALGLYNVQGTAKLAGVSFDETVTALAQLAPSFASSADAGTSLKTFLSRMQPTTKPAIAAMQDLGLMAFDTSKALKFLAENGVDAAGMSVEQMQMAITNVGFDMGKTDDQVTKLLGTFKSSVFYDAQGNFVGMAKASELLHDATKDLTEAQRVQALQTIFGQDAIRVAAVLADQGATGYNNMSEALAKQSSVADMAKQKQAGFNTAIDNFKGSVEALQITIGSVLLPVLTDLFNNYLAPGINTLTDLAGALSGDNDAFGRLSPIMQTVVDIVEGLIGIFQSSEGEFSTMGGAIDGLSSTWDHFSSVVQAVGGAYEAIAKAVLPIVTKFWADHGEEITDFMQKAFAMIMKIINAALDLYKAIVPPILNAIAGFIQNHGTLIEAIFTNIWHIISGIIDGALTLILGIIQTATKLIQGDWQGAWTTIKDMSARFVEDLWKVIKGGLELIANLFGSSLQGIADTWASNWRHFKQLVEMGADGLVKLFLDLPEQVAGVGEAIVNAIWEGIKSTWHKVVDWFNQKLQDLKDSLPFSEPKDPRSPLRGLTKSGMALVEQIQQGIDMAGALRPPGIMRLPAAPNMAMGANISNVATYNQPRTVNLNYQTQYAPPVSTSLALANALAGY